MRQTLAVGLSNNHHRAGGLKRNLLGSAIGIVLLSAPLLAIEREFTPQPTFREALPGYDYIFPQDHGSHDLFRTEWWYFTGHLFSTDGQRFGYQLTFFRRAIGDERVWRNPSRWALRQLYFAHFALTDLAKEQFRYAEKISRAGIGKAGAETGTLHTWIDQWSVKAVTPNHHELHLKASTPEYSLDLIVVQQKPPVVHGLEGISAKGHHSRQRSHYYSLTRLATKGVLRVDGEKKEVHGSSWMDHEFGSAELAKGLVGWDWFSIQLESGYDIMVYWLRRRDGTFDPSSSGTLVSPNGSTRHLTREDLKLDILGYWYSQESGARYPSRWRLVIVPYRLHLTISPHLPNQELRTSRSTQITYWEGAVEVKGRAENTQVNGMGYVELTGYAAPYDPG